MPRLYLEPAEFVVDTVPLDGARARRLRQVLRLRAGAELRVFDGLGHERGATLEIAGAEVTLRLGATVTPLPEAAVPVTLCCAFPRGERGDWLVEKATELGVASFIALDADRAVLRPGEGRFERWRRVVIEAAEQCGRAVVPPFVEAPPAGALELVADLAAEVALPIALASGVRSGGVVVFVGPEGGWTDEERAAHRAAGRTFVSLGPRTLRVETAGVTAVALAVTTLNAAGASTTR